jgi:hypothetical protein
MNRTTDKNKSFTLNTDFQTTKLETIIRSFRKRNPRKANRKERNNLRL